MEKDYEKIEITYKPGYLRRLHVPSREITQEERKEAINSLIEDAICTVTSCDDTLFSYCHAEAAHNSISETAGRLVADCVPQKFTAFWSRQCPPLKELRRVK